MRGEGILYDVGFRILDMGEAYTRWMYPGLEGGDLVRIWDATFEKTKKGKGEGMYMGRGGGLSFRGKEAVPYTPHS